MEKDVATLPLTPALLYITFPSVGVETCYCFQAHAPPALWPWLPLKPTVSFSACVSVSFPPLVCWHPACWGSLLLRPPLSFWLCFCQRSIRYGASGPGDAREGCDCNNKPSKKALGGATWDSVLMVLPSSGEQRQGTETKETK